MPEKIELLLEAEKRGILPEDKQAILGELRRRGIVPDPSYRGKRINNPDGTFSSERTKTFEFDGKYYNIPTLVNGIQLSDDEAIAKYRSGEVPAVGVADTLEEAAKMAGERSAMLGKEGRNTKRPLGAGRDISRPKQSLLETFKEEIPRVGGGIVGGIVGSPGGIPGVIGGVAYGAGLGEALNQIRKQVTGSPSAPKTSTEAALDIAKISRRELTGEILGRGIVYGAGKVLAPFTKKVTQEAAEAISYLKNKIKPVLTPAEATESRLLDVLENISEASLLGGGKISQFKLARKKIMEEVSDDIIDSFGKRVEPDEVGELFIRTIQGKNDAFKAASDIFYNNVEELTKGELKKVPIQEMVTSNILDKSGKPLAHTVTKMVEKRVGQARVSTKRIKDFAKPIIELNKDIAGIEEKNAGVDLMRSIMGMPKEIDFATAKELRSRLISRADEYSVLNPKAKVIGKAKKAVAILDQSIESELKKYKNPEALEAWRVANKFYKTGKEDFDNIFIRRLVKKGGEEPEAIAKAIFKPGAISNIRKVKKAVDQPTWEELKSYYVQRVFSQSVDQEGNILGIKMVNNLYGRAGMGKQTLSEIFTPEQLIELTRFSNALKVAQTKQAEGLGKMWIQLTQAGAVATMVGIGSMPGAGGFLLGPPLLARLMLNPTTARLLTQGYKLSANSPKIAGILARLIRAAYQMQREDKRQFQLSGVK